MQFIDLDGLKMPNLFVRFFGQGVWKESVVFNCLSPVNRLCKLRAQKELFIIHLIYVKKKILNNELQKFGGQWMGYKNQWLLQDFGEKSDKLNSCKLNDVQNFKYPYFGGNPNLYIIIGYWRRKRV